MTTSSPSTRPTPRTGSRSRPGFFNPLDVRVDPADRQHLRRRVRQRPRGRRRPHHAAQAGAGLAPHPGRQDQLPGADLRRAHRATRRTTARPTRPPAASAGWPPAPPRPSASSASGRDRNNANSNQLLDTFVHMQDTVTGPGRLAGGGAVRLLRRDRRRRRRRQRRQQHPRGAAPRARWWSRRSRRPPATSSAPTTGTGRRDRRLPHALEPGRHEHEDRLRRHRPDHDQRPGPDRHVEPEGRAHHQRPGHRRRTSPARSPSSPTPPTSAPASAPSPTRSTVGASTPYSGPITVSTAGNHTVVVTATDGAGNTGSASSSFTITAPAGSPTIKVDLARRRPRAHLPAGLQHPTRRGRRRPSR